MLLFLCCVVCLNMYYKCDFFLLLHLITHILVQYLILFLFGFCCCSSVPTFRVFMYSIHIMALATNAKVTSYRFNSFALFKCVNILRRYCWCCYCSCFIQLNLQEYVPTYVYKRDIPCVCVFVIFDII